MDHQDYQSVCRILSDTTRQFYVFDGLIGAGKTTLITRLSEHMRAKGQRVHAILEPVDIWHSTGALQYFYEDISNRCYEFQTFTYITRIKRVLQELAKHPDCDIYLLERSIWSDRYIFVALLEKLMGTTRMTMYNCWWDMWSIILPLNPTKWISLNTSVNEACCRINSRKRDGEAKIDEEYMLNLDIQQQKMYDMLENDGKTVVRIGKELMDADFKASDEILVSIAELIF